MRAFPAPSLTLLAALITAGPLLAACGDTPRGPSYVSPDSGFAADWYVPQPDPLPPDMSVGGDAAPATCPVTDVSASDASYAAVCWVVGKGVMDAPGGQFNPEGTFTRAVMARHLILLKHGTSFQISTSNTFSDVPQSDPHYRYIQKLVDDGITVGCNVAGDKFCPGDAATNAHGASFAVRMKLNAQPFTISSEQPYFTDVPSSHWGFRTIQRIHEDKAGVPCGAQTYCPDTAITRGKWARVLYRYFSGN